MEAKDEGVEILVAANHLDSTRQQLQQAEFKVITAELIYKPLALMALQPEQEESLAGFLDNFWRKN